MSCNIRNNQTTLKPSNPKSAKYAADFMVVSIDEFNVVVAAQLGVS